MKINIEINENNVCKVIYDNDGIKISKKIAYGTLIDLLNASTSEFREHINKEDIIYSEILPGDKLISTVQIKNIPKIKSVWYVLLREGQNVDMRYNNNVYRKVAMPKTIFAIKVCNNRCASLRICCIKDNFINNETIIYKYPYSNVFDTRSVCLGGNMINNYDLGNITNISMIPEMFLAMDNNNDGYSNSNNSGFIYEELLNLLEGSSFDNDILSKSHNTPTYRDFIDSLQ